jgi:O-antigen/teichoic acid export membrane protein/peptidoglycan/xylan/chitin deacetylase (PgdA/CDA1 family)
MANMSNTKKHIGISFATQYMELSIHFLAVLVLARILTPSDIGTYSVAAFLMALLHMFRDFGVIQYIIQEQELTIDKIRSAMGVSIILAFLVAGILLASSHFLGNFYNNAAIEEILVVMSASFAISPFGSLLLGMFRRNMQLKSIFITKIVSALCHVAVALTLALNGLGAMSLAWANFAGILTFGIVANLMRPKDYPWLPRFNNIKTILSFGGIASLGNAANMAGTNMPDLVIGKVMDMSAVGYFSRANGLIQLFSKLITSALLPLVLPYFSQLRRDGKDLAAPYLSAVEYLTAFAWPFFAVTMLLAQPMIRTLYGPQWDASVPIVELLCLAGAISSISLFATQVMVAKGQVRNSTYAHLLAMPFRVGAILIASLYGLASIAIAIIISEFITLIIISWYLHQTIKIGPVELIAASGKSAVIAVCSAIIPLLVKLFLNDAPPLPWFSLSIGIAGAGLGWVAGIFLTRHPLAEQIIGLIPLLGFRQFVADKRKSSMLKYLKLMLKKLVYQLGLLGVYHRLRNRNFLTVAMFHRVLPSSDPQHPGADPEWTMAPETLTQCLSFFSKHYQIVSPDQVFLALQGGLKLPPRSLLVTFDDGWADTANYAHPILHKFSIPALIFVAGSAMNKKNPFWEERIYRFLATNPEGLIQFEKLLNSFSVYLALQDSSSMNEHKIRSIISQLGKLDKSIIDAITDKLPETDNGQTAMLDTRALAMLVGSLHTIGGHGMTHKALTKVDNLDQELRHAQDTMSAYLNGQPVRAMSFPHGEYSDHVIARCLSAGYEFLFGSDAILNPLNPKFGKRSVLGRIHISEREILDKKGKFQPSLLAAWMFLRPGKGGRDAA